MFFHKIRQFYRAIKWHRQIRQAVSTQITLLESPSVFALGGLTDLEENALAELVASTSASSGPVIEFGTLFGLTTRLLATSARPDQRVITIDNFSWNPFGLPPEIHEKMARKVLRTELSSGRVELFVASIAEFRSSYNGAAPALVFLDADHSYAAVHDEIVWAKKVGTAVIAGHDYGHKRYGVTRAVDEMFVPGSVQIRGSLWAWKAAGAL